MNEHALEGEPGELWIEIPHWERFQHYADRRPPWIKFYVELLDNPNYGQLTHAQRSTLCGLWLMYARSHCEIPVNTAWITRQLGVKVTRETLEALNHAGFIDFVASKPLAECSPRARPRGRRETETETETQEQDLSDQNQNPPSRTTDVARENGNVGHALAPIDWQTALDSVSRNRTHDLSEEP